MSVLIKGMKMPEKCGSCDLFHVESPMHCTAVKGHKTVGAPYGMPRPDWCPLVEIPEPHEGEWVYGEDSTADCVDGYRCSQCGFFVPWDYNHKLIDYINDYAYCPNCRARMKGAKHETD